MTTWWSSTKWWTSPRCAWWVMRGDRRWTWSWSWRASSTSPQSTLAAAVIAMWVATAPQAPGPSRGTHGAVPAAPHQDRHGQDLGHLGPQPLAAAGQEVGAAQGAAVVDSTVPCPPAPTPVQAWVLSQCQTSHQSAMQCTNSSSRSRAREWQVSPSCHTSSVCPRLPVTNLLLHRWQRPTHHRLHLWPTCHPLHHHQCHHNVYQPMR